MLGGDFLGLVAHKFNNLWHGAIVASPPTRQNKSNRPAALWDFAAPIFFSSISSLIFDGTFVGEWTGSLVIGQAIFALFNLRTPRGDLRPNLPAPR
jgi:hypothetical protein